MGLLPLLAALLPSLAQYTVVLPGLAGIGLGRNPNGAVNDLREGFEPIVRTRVVLVATVAVLAGLYAIRMLEVIDNWTYAILTIVTPLVAVGVATALQRGPVGRGPAGPAEVPLEWRGVTEPWTDDDARELDRVLGMSEVEIHGAARG
jgi:branched-chain amino acid transport system permease protein